MSNDSGNKRLVLKVLFLPRFGRLGASSRLRAYQFFPFFIKAGIICNVSPLFTDGMLLKKYKTGSYALRELFFAYCRRMLTLFFCRKYDLVWVEKESLPWFPLCIERWLLQNVKYVIDFDDAIFHTYDLHRSNFIRNFYGDRIDLLMKNASIVVAGNQYLADRARVANASRIDLIPTVVDLNRYIVKSNYSTSSDFRIVWIGTPSTIKYLYTIKAPLKELAKLYKIVIRVIGCQNISISGLNIEAFPWSEDSEVRLISESDIGVMPLENGSWEKGKCAYKLIQYMACGLPAVCSPVGANSEVVMDGNTGFFANSDSEWIEKLNVLLSSVERRKSMGLAGRARVQELYCLEKVAPDYASLLRDTCVKDTDI